MAGRLAWLTRLGGSAVVGAGVAGYFIGTKEPELGSSNVVDVVVVGGGIVGTSIALGVVRHDHTLSYIRSYCTVYGASRHRLSSAHTLGSFVHTLLLTGPCLAH
jgi:hypothetical protein